jgi:hypothetical protein
MPPSPRVRCGSCAFEWFGATAAHGLRIVGSCPKCGGELEFLAHDDEPAALAAPVPERLRALHPAAVLGTPTSWAR